MKIAVAGTGYVGLSMAILLAQHNTVKAVDVVQAKVDMINNKKSPIVDAEIEEYLATKKLDLEATTDGDSAYKDAELVIVSTPTNYDEKKNYFDTSSVKPMDLYKSYPASVDSSSTKLKFSSTASCSSVFIIAFAYPLCRHIGFVYTLSTVPVLPVMNIGFAGFSTISKNAQATTSSISLIR